MPSSRGWLCACGGCGERGRRPCPDQQAALVAALTPSASGRPHPGLPCRGAISRERCAAPLPAASAEQLWARAPRRLPQQRRVGGALVSSQLGWWAFSAEAPLPSSWPPEVSLETQLVPEEVSPGLEGVTGHSGPEGWPGGWHGGVSLGSDQEATCPRAAGGIQERHSTPIPPSHPPPPRSPRAGVRTAVWVLRVSQPGQQAPVRVCALCPGPPPCPWPQLRHTLAGALLSLSPLAYGLHLCGHQHRPPLALSPCCSESGSFHLMQPWFL